MDPSQQDALSKPGSTDTRPLGFMQRLDPSPVQDPVFDLETGEYQPQTRDPNPSQRDIAPSRVSVAGFGLRGFRWDSWCTSLTMFLFCPCLIVLMAFVSSICGPEILDVSTYIVLRLTFRQYLSYSPGNSLCIRQ